MTLGLDSNELLDELERASQQLIEQVNDLQPNEANRSSKSGEWSVKEVICHLGDADQIYIQRVQKMLQEDEPILKAFKPETLAKENNYNDQEWSNSLRRFVIGRQQLITTFRNLRPGQWYKAGMHQELGRINMFDIVQTIVEHTQNHLDQARKNVD